MEHFVDGLHICCVILKGLLQACGRLLFMTSYEVYGSVSIHILFLSFFKQFRELRVEHMALWIALGLYFILKYVMSLTFRLYEFNSLKTSILERACQSVFRQ